MFRFQVQVRVSDADRRNTPASYQQEEHQHIDGAGTAAAVSVLKSDEGKNVEGKGNVSSDDRREKA